MNQGKNLFQPLPLPERRGGEQVRAISLPTTIGRVWLLLALMAGILSLKPFLTPKAAQLAGLPSISGSVRPEMLDFELIGELAAYPAREAFLYDESSIRPEPWVTLLPAISATIRGATGGEIAARLSPVRSRNVQSRAQRGAAPTHVPAPASELPLDPIGDGIPVTITAYSSEAAQTDSDPHITATGTTTRPGVLALSRDLIENFTPGAPFRFGETVYLPGFGVFHIEDTMSPRFSRRVDIWFPNSEAALEFGRRHGQLFLSGGRTPGYGPEVLRAVEASARVPDAPVEAAADPTAPITEPAPAASGS